MYSSIMAGQVMFGNWRILLNRFLYWAKTNRLRLNNWGHFYLQHNFSRLPALSGGPGAVSQAEFANEREILYKLFFDMKKDVNELKKMFFDLVQNPGVAQHMPVYNQDAGNGIKELTPTVSSNNFNQAPPALFIARIQYSDSAPRRSGRIVEYYGTRKRTDHQSAEETPGQKKRRFSRPRYQRTYPLPETEQIRYRKSVIKSDK